MNTNMLALVEVLDSRYKDMETELIRVSTIRNAKPYHVSDTEREIFGDIECTMLFMDSYGESKYVTKVIAESLEGFSRRVGAVLLSDGHPS